MMLRQLQLLALVFAAALFPRWGLAEQSELPPIKKSLRITEAYACSLNVWNEETQTGEQDVKLTDLRIVLRANYLGSSLRERKAAPKKAETQGHFRLKQLALKYYKDWRGPQSNPAQLEVVEGVEWDKLKIRAWQEFPLQQLSSDSALPLIDLHSAVKMARNDLMRIGQFEFVAELAGFYELRFQVYQQRRLTFETSELIEFRCPDERPQLAILKAGVLHEVRVPYIHIPLVASTFFEPGSAQWNQNSTDRIFRSVFWGLTAKRSACNPLDARLLLLEDPTSSASAPVQEELAQRRAETLQQFAQEKAESFHGHVPCAGLMSARNGSVNGHAATICSTGIRIEKPWAGQSEVFIKSTGSEVSPQWFDEENRVVPLVASLAAQRTIFQPIKLKPLEDSDYIELRCENNLPEALLGCVRSAILEITNSRGEKRVQKLRWEDLQAASLRLDSPELREFLVPGKFHARLVLQTSYSNSPLSSATESFTIARRNIVRDEVFALSPYDRVDLIYALDHERIAELSAEIVRTVRDSLTANSADLFVLITGHSDSLGEHRPQGVGRDYNLALAFNRALYLRRLLTDSLRARAAHAGLTAHLRSEALSIPPVFRENVARHVSNAAITEVFKLPNCIATECAEDERQKYLDMLIEEKLRHFKAGMRTEGAQFADVPSATEVRTRIEVLRPLLPLEVATLTFEVAGQLRRVHLVSTGLGAAVPFYRRLEISEELQEVFCRMGFAPEEMPQFFFGKDAFPAGRLMNRRVELNMLW